VSDMNHLSDTLPINITRLKFVEDWNDKLRLELEAATAELDNFYQWMEERKDYKAECIKLRAENAELRKLVQDAYIAGCKGYGIITWWGDFQEYKAQHPILKDQP
jgi:hypothetical protein